MTGQMLGVITAKKKKKEKTGQRKTLNKQWPVEQNLKCVSSFKIELDKNRLEAPSKS